MSGFPSRLLRSMLGPRLRDRRPVENPETEIPASAFEALFRQVCGLNLGAARVQLIAHYTGGVFQIRHQSEAWAPDNDQAHPVLERGSAGMYTYTFASQYKDGEGRDVITELFAARATWLGVAETVGARGSAHAWVHPNDPLVIHIRTFDDAGDPSDEPFWLEVF